MQACAIEVKIPLGCKKTYNFDNDHWLWIIDLRMGHRTVDTSSKSENVQLFWWTENIRRRFLKKEKENIRLWLWPLIMNYWFKDGPSNSGYHFEVRKHTTYLMNRKRTTLILAIDYELLIYGWAIEQQIPLRSVFCW